MKIIIFALFLLQTLSVYSLAPTSFNFHNQDTIDSFLSDRVSHKKSSTSESPSLEDEGFLNEEEKKEYLRQQKTLKTFNYEELQSQFTKKARNERLLEHKGKYEHIFIKSTSELRREKFFNNFRQSFPKKEEKIDPEQAVQDFMQSCIKAGISFREEPTPTKEKKSAPIKCPPVQATISLLQPTSPPSEEPQKEHSTTTLIFKENLIQDIEKHLKETLTNEEQQEPIFKQIISACEKWKKEKILQSEALILYKFIFSLGFLKSSLSLPGVGPISQSTFYQKEVFRTCLIAFKTIYQYDPRIIDEVSIYPNPLHVLIQKYLQILIIHYQQTQEESQEEREHLFQQFKDYFNLSCDLLEYTLPCDNTIIKKTFEHLFLNPNLLMELVPEAFEIPEENYYTYLIDTLNHIAQQKKEEWKVKEIVDTLHQLLSAKQDKQTTLSAETTTNQSLISLIYITDFTQKIPKQKTKKEHLLNNNQLLNFIQHAEESLKQMSPTHQDEWVQQCATSCLPLTSYINAKEHNSIEQVITHLLSLSHQTLETQGESLSLKPLIEAFFKCNPQTQKKDIYSLPEEVFYSPQLFLYYIKSNQDKKKPFYRQQEEFLKLIQKCPVPPYPSSQLHIALIIHQTLSSQIFQSLNQEIKQKYNSLILFQAQKVQHILNLIDSFHFFMTAQYQGTTIEIQTWIETLQEELKCFNTFKISYQEDSPIDLHLFCHAYLKISFFAQTILPLIQEGNRDSIVSQEAQWPDPFKHMSLIVQENPLFYSYLLHLNLSIQPFNQLFTPFPSSFILMHTVQCKTHSTNKSQHLKFLSKLKFLYDNPQVADTFFKTYGQIPSQYQDSTPFEKHCLKLMSQSQKENEYLKTHNKDTVSSCIRSHIPQGIHIKRLVNKKRFPTFDSLLLSSEINQVTTDQKESFLSHKQKSLRLQQANSQQQKEDINTLIPLCEHLSQKLTKLQLSADEIILFFPLSQQHTKEQINFLNIINHFQQFEEVHKRECLTALLNSKKSNAEELSQWITQTEKKIETSRMFISVIKTAPSFPTSVEIPHPLSIILNQNCTKSIPSPIKKAFFSKTSSLTIKKWLHLLGAHELTSQNYDQCVQIIERIKLLNGCRHEILTLVNLAQRANLKSLNSLNYSDLSDNDREIVPLINPLLTDPINKPLFAKLSSYDNLHECLQAITKIENQVMKFKQNTETLKQIIALRKELKLQSPLLLFSKQEQDTHQIGLFFEEIITHKIPPDKLMLKIEQQYELKSENLIFIQKRLLLIKTLLPSLLEIKSKHSYNQPTEKAIQKLAERNQLPEDDEVLFYKMKTLNKDNDKLYIDIFTCHLLPFITTDTQDEHHFCCSKIEKLYHFIDQLLENDPYKQFIDEYLSNVEEIKQQFQPFSFPSDQIINEIKHISPVLCLLLSISFNQNEQTKGIYIVLSELSDQPQTELNRILNQVRFICNVIQKASFLNHSDNLNSPDFWQTIFTYFPIMPSSHTEEAFILMLKIYTFTCHIADQFNFWINDIPSNLPLSFKVFFKYLDHYKNNFVLKSTVFKKSFKNGLLCYMHNNIDQVTSIHFQDEMTFRIRFLDGFLYALIKGKPYNQVSITQRRNIKNTPSFYLVHKNEKKVKENESEEPHLWSVFDLTEEMFSWLQPKTSLEKTTRFVSRLTETSMQIVKSILCLPPQLTFKIIKATGFFCAYFAEYPISGTLICLSFATTPLLIYRDFFLIVDLFKTDSQNLVANMPSVSLCHNPHQFFFNTLDQKDQNVDALLEIEKRLQLDCPDKSLLSEFPFIQQQLETYQTFHSFLSASHYNQKHIQKKHRTFDKQMARLEEKIKHTKKTKEKQLLSFYQQELAIMQDLWDFINQDFIHPKEEPSLSLQKNLTAKNMKMRLQQIYSNIEQLIYSRIKFIQKYSYLNQPVTKENESEKQLQEISVTYFLYILSENLIKTFPEFGIKTSSHRKYINENFHVFTPLFVNRQDKELYNVIETMNKAMQGYSTFLGCIANAPQPLSPSLVTTAVNQCRKIFLSSKEAFNYFVDLQDFAHYNPQYIKLFQLFFEEMDKKIELIDAIPSHMPPSKQQVKDIIASHFVQKTERIKYLRSIISEQFPDQIDKKSDYKLLATRLFLDLTMFIFEQKIDNLYLQILYDIFDIKFDVLAAQPMKNEIYPQPSDIDLTLQFLQFIPTKWESHMASTLRSSIFNPEGLFSPATQLHNVPFFTLASAILQSVFYSESLSASTETFQRNAEIEWNLLAQAFENHPSTDYYKVKRSELSKKVQEQLDKHGILETTFSTAPFLTSIPNHRQKNHYLNSKEVIHRKLIKGLSSKECLLVIDKLIQQQSILQNEFKFQKAQKQKVYSMYGLSYLYTVFHPNVVPSILIQAQISDDPILFLKRTLSNQTPKNILLSRPNQESFEEIIDIVGPYLKNYKFDTHHSHENHVNYLNYVFDKKDVKKPLWFFENFEDVLTIDQFINQKNHPHSPLDENLQQNLNRRQANGQTSQWQPSLALISLTGLLTVKDHIVNFVNWVTGEVPDEPVITEFIEEPIVTESILPLKTVVHRTSQSYNRYA